MFLQKLEEVGIHRREPEYIHPHEHKNQRFTKMAKNCEHSLDGSGCEEWSELAWDYHLLQRGAEEWRFAQWLSNVSPDGRHHSAGGKSKSRRSLTERRNPDGGVRCKFGGRNKLVGFSSCDIALKGFGTIYSVSMIEHIRFYEMI